MYRLALSRVAVLATLFLNSWAAYAQTDPVQAAIAAAAATPKIDLNRVSAGGFTAMTAETTDRSIWTIKGSEVYQIGPSTPNPFGDLKEPLAKISASSNGEIWVVGVSKEVWKRVKNGGVTWELQPNLALRDISFGADGSAWAIGSQVDPTGNSPILRWSNNARQWQTVAGSATQIAVDPKGTPWVVTAAGVPFRYNHATESWNQYEGAYRAIAISPTGIMVATALDGGFRIWDGVSFVGAIPKVGTTGLSLAPNAAFALNIDGSFLLSTGADLYRSTQPVQPPIRLSTLEIPPSPPQTSIPPATSDLCWKETATRGVGKIPNNCPAGTEKSGALCYPACRAGFSGVGPVCWKFPESYGRGAGVIPNDCGPNADFDAGLCYSKCPQNTSGVGPVCWATCAPPYPQACGASCAQNLDMCALGITAQVTEPFNVLINIAGLVATGGGANAAVASVKNAGQTAAREAAKQGASAAFKESAKAMLLQTAKEVGKEFGETAAGALAQDVYNASVGNDFDFSTLDITGVTSLIMAYNKPMCSSFYPPPKVTPSGNPINTQVFAVDKLNRLWANMGGVWMQFPNGSNTKMVAAALDGTLWRLTTAGAVYAWGGGQGWIQIGKPSDPPFTFLAVGSATSVWALDAKGKPYRWEGASWSPVYGILKNIASGADGETWGTNTEDRIFRWDADNRTWVNYSTGAARLSKITVGNRDNVMGINTQGNVWKFRAPNDWYQVSMDYFPTQIVAGGSGDIWILNEQNQPFRMVDLRQQGSTWLMDARRVDFAEFQQISIR